MDALGELARMGLAQFGRQALAGSHYGLLQETTHTPNPDYWVLWLWKQMMGSQVLDATLTSAKQNPSLESPSPSPSVADMLHVYAHCRPQQSSSAGTAVLAFVNISPNTTHSLTVAGAGSNGALAMYTFSTPGGTNSNMVSLNGIPLEMSGDSLPKLPAAVLKPSTAPVPIPPLSYGFIALPGAIEACTTAIHREAA
jgi:heparanase 1